MFHVDNTLVLGWNLVSRNYEKLPMQFSEKVENFIGKNDVFFFHDFAQNIDCGYTLEPPR